MTFVCPVPNAHCTGFATQVEPLKRHRGCHSSIKEMHKCIGNYHVTVLGYTQKSRREFVDPETNRVLVISKKPGIPLRRGKEGSRFIHRTWYDNRRAWTMPW